MPRQITIIKDIIANPASAFKEISKNPKKFLAVSVSLLAGVALIEILDWYVFQGKNNFGLSMLIVFEVIFVPIIIFKFGNWTGQKSTFSNFLSIFGYVAVPWIFYAIIKNLLIFIGLDFLDLTNPDGTSDTVLSAAIGIWAIILGIYALKQIHEITKFKAFLIIALSLISASAVGYFFIIVWIANGLF